MTVLDIGANLGVYTILSALKVGPTGAVHAFEPVPQLHDYLSESVRRSGFENVHLNRLGLGDQSGQVSIYCLSSPYGGGHSLAPSPKPSRQIDARCIRLDDYITEKQVERVDFLKIDIEGGELAAFKGAGSLLSRTDAPMIQCELSDRLCHRWGHQARDVKQYLWELGYRGYLAQPNHQWKPVSAESPHPKTVNVLFFQAHHLAQLPGRDLIPSSSVRG